MSAITATNVYQESAGSMKAHICTFAIGAAPGDTYVSSIPNIMFSVAQGQTGTQTGTCVSSTFDNTNSVITFGGGVSATMPAFTLLVLSKSG
jgi:hypothetical protein